MHIKKKINHWLAGSAFFGIAGIASLSAQDSEPVSTRILKWSEAEQVAWLKSYLAEGMPPGEGLTMLVLNKSLIALPLLEQEIEEILHSKSPQQLFSNPAADPQTVVIGATSMIEYAGDAQSLREASKLMKIDEHRFGGMVNSALLHAETNRNPFTVAYQGFDIGDPEVDKRILAWAEVTFALKGQLDHNEKRRWLAEAMVARYNGVPSGAQWTNDPIVSKLDPSKYAGLHDEMLPFTVEAAKKRSKQ
jgi:hypothetical protein